MEIRVIKVNSNEYKQMVALRMNVLLDPIGIPWSYINPQKEENDLLIGAFEEQELIGCCILTAVDQSTIQLRQMAVKKNAQQSGIGRKIVAFAETLARQNGYSTLMMHARDNVLQFYIKCGYNISGEQFTEVGIDHHRMEKQL